MPSDFQIFDQGYLGSCTANAVVALKEYNDHIDNTAAQGYYFNLSRLFLYWHERDLINTINEDSGAFIRDGMKVMNQIGCCGESFFPYDPHTFTNTPSKDAEENAGLHKISEYHRVMTLHDLKSALAQGKPVVFGMDVYASFESEEVAHTGYVPMPQPGEQNLGGHAVLAVGYKDGYIIVRNSWGEAWGDKGYFYLPEAYFESHVQDMWSGK
jgi:C1A family cysteine protease